MIIPPLCRLPRPYPPRRLLDECLRRRVVLFLHVLEEKGARKFYLAHPDEVSPADKKGRHIVGLFFPCCGGPVTGGSVYLADSLPGLDRTVRPRPNSGRTGRGAETLSRIAAMAVEWYG